MMRDGILPLYRTRGLAGSTQPPRSPSESGRRPSPAPGAQPAQRRAHRLSRGAGRLPTHRSGQGPCVTQVHGTGR
jgi:hypothetical protein